jgi:hypothetical protein
VNSPRDWGSVLEQLVAARKNPDPRQPNTWIPEICEWARYEPWLGKKTLKNAIRTLALLKKLNVAVRSVRISHEGGVAFYVRDHSWLFVMNSYISLTIGVALKAPRRLRFSHMQGPPGRTKRAAFVEKCALKLRQETANAPAQVAAP